MAGRPSTSRLARAYMWDDKRGRELGEREKIRDSASRRRFPAPSESPGTYSGPIRCILFFFLFFSLQRQERFSPHTSLSQFYLTPRCLTSLRVALKDQSAKSSILLQLVFHSRSIFSLSLSLSLSLYLFGKNNFYR